MERGLIWLPLLAAFIGLAWAGWHEYQKLNVCQTWAQQFDRYKYDVACVLGQGAGRLVWGKPTRQGPTDLQTLDLSQIRSLRLFITDRATQTDRLLSPAEAAALETAVEPLGLLVLTDASEPVKIPFTDLALAIVWAERLLQDR